VKVQNATAESCRIVRVLHYTGADHDRGGIMSVAHALAGAGIFECCLGVNAGFTQRRSPPLPVVEFPSIASEVIGVQTFWRARAVAREARAWLGADATRIFHGHSRAGLLVALWLVRSGERRVVVSVHCYGRQRWFYRWAADRLGDRLYWLSPAMKRYYNVDDRSWDQCIPECVAPSAGRIERSLAGKNGLLRLGGIGSFVAWKGWHLVVDALGALPPELRGKISFRHIGAAENSAASQRYAAELQARVGSRECPTAIEWLGQRSSSEGLLREIDCLVVASRNEPFSVAVLEALAAGVPVLAADSGGATDIIKPGENGWLFRTADAAALARAITMLATTDALAKARVPPDTVRPFLAPVVAARWLQVYRAVGGF
jgi:glycosyltransferase involved in cell wall biosynthesis